MTDDPRIPPLFVAKDGELAIGGRKASEWVAANGGETPLFVYDRAIIQDRIDALRAALPAEVGIHYAVKANPMPALIEWIAPRMDGLRSEEHTSEIQSLMRISYAVFCLNKK